MQAFQIHNTSRDPLTRAVRRESGNKRQQLILGSGKFRVMRARPVTVLEPIFMGLLDELKEKEAKGLIKVTTPAGLRVDLSTFETAAALPTTPLPNFPLDSAARDSYNQWPRPNTPEIAVPHLVTAAKEAVETPQLLSESVNNEVTDLEDFDTGQVTGN